MENLDCIAEFRQWVNKQKQKEWNKEKKVRKEALKTVQELVLETQKTFNEFIRLRDKGLNCISCNKPPKKENAGHYFNANNHWNVRFDEDNVHLQCEHCNSYLSGNLIPYRENLIKKIGRKRFDALSAIAYKTRKFTREELREIKDYYKNKIREIKN